MSTMRCREGIVDVDAGTGTCQELLCKFHGILFLQWTKEKKRKKKKKNRKKGEKEKGRMKKMIVNKRIRNRSPETNVL